MECTLVTMVGIVCIAFVAAFGIYLLRNGGPKE